MESPKLMYENEEVLCLCIETVIKIEGKYDIAIRQEELQGGTLDFRFH